MNKSYSALLIGLLICLALIGNSYYAYGKQRNTTDLDTLLLSANAYFHEAPTVTLSYFGNLEAVADANELVRKGTELSDRLGLPAGTLETQKNTIPAYTVNQTTDRQIRIYMKLAEMPGHNSTALSLTLQSQDAAAVPAMQTIKDEIEKSLSGLLSHPQWTTVLQGELSGGMDEAMESLSRQFELTELKRYQDVGTVSISYHSKYGQPTSPRFGKKDTNFQVAIHRNSETGESKLTLGAPAIHIEY